MVRPSDFLDAVCAVCVRQMSDLESELDPLESSGTVPETVSEAVSSRCTVPVIGEAFCPCYPQEDSAFGVITECSCGEQDQSK